MKKIELEKNIPIEVSKEQYNKAKKAFSGIIAHRKDGDKYYIKLMLGKYKDQLEFLLNN